MKITHKLIALVLLAALGLITLTAVNYSKFAAVKTNALDVTDEIVPSIIAIQHAELEFAMLRREVLSHIIEKDPAKMQELERSIEQDKAKLDEYLKAYEHFIFEEADRKNFTQLKQELDAWYPLAKEALRLSAADQTDAAMDFVRQKLTPVATRAFQSFETVSNFNEALAKKAGEELKQDVLTAISASITISVIIIGLVVALGFFIGRSIITPLQRMREFVVRLGSDYDFTQRVTVTTQDEIGESLQALNGLLNSLQQSLQQLNRIGRDVTSTASSLSNASRELSETSQQVSQSASSMAAGVEEVTVSISHVADRAGECDSTAREAGQMAATGGEVIETTIHNINAIAEQVRVAAAQIESLKDRTGSINAVVNVIKEIADQTNLLALNAAIEAARAGEQGRGFAVVADEVRKLAERTGNSTQEIIGTVSAIQQEANNTVATMQRSVQQVDDGVQGAHAASDAIQRIRHNADAVVAQVSEITASMREQSSASAMMAQQVERVAQMSEESSSVANNTANEGSRLRQLSDELDAAIGRYKV
ncbi:methyl-accepting chemotaxis protein [Chitinibacter sp. ZOR0017]|uniref:methyl-accepting chemotaxis protein n=1 Tax=Chitinibacter sp. ZOR0017 TaxID=1339254 RepID=UPI00068E0097|nr:methyl-accepting chemotaxis protein [Chitinibacter sp. ZOR0017]